MLPLRTTTSSSTKGGFDAISSHNSPLEKSTYQRRRKSNNSSLSNVPMFFKRLMRFSQMDFEFALWQMLYLCISPKRVYKNIYYHKQTKNRWSRDDPAFVVLLSLCLVVSAIAYGVAYSLRFSGILMLILYMVFVDFIVVGVTIATITWLFCNRFLLSHQLHASEQSVEWGYSYDVHCNSFFPTFLITYVLQFFFIPILDNERWISLFLGNTMYLASVCIYVYITFLGFSALPFLRKTTVFLYPIGIAVIFYIFSLFGFSVSRSILHYYFETTY